MKPTKHIIILFLTINLSSCYHEPKICDDVNELCELNSSVIQFKSLFSSPQATNNLCSLYESKELFRYSNTIKVSENDTTYTLGYIKSIFRQQDNSSMYSSLVFTKYYFEKNLYHMLELFNQDTLYHYTTVKPIEDSYFFTDYIFKKGKYFFMFERSKKYDSFGQKIFFYNNYDSLVNIKGDIIPALPSIDSISMKDFHESEFYKNFKKDKPYLF